jgi:hypothetical protein
MFDNTCGNTSVGVHDDFFQSASHLTNGNTHNAFLGIKLTSD